MKRSTLRTSLYCVAFVALAPGALPSFAGAQPLSLVDAVKIAIEKNPEIQAAKQDVEVVRTKITQVRAQGRPQVGLEFSYIHLKEAPVVDLGPELSPAFNGIANILKSENTIFGIQNQLIGGLNTAVTAQNTILNTYYNPTLGTLTGNPAFTAVGQNLTAIGQNLATVGGTVSQLNTSVAQLGVGIDTLKSQLERTTFSLPLSKQDMRRLTLNFTWPVFTSVRVSRGTAAAKKATETVEARVESKRREVAYNVVKAYLGATLARQVAAVNDETYDTIRQHVDQAEKLFKSGIIPKYELMRAQTELANQDKRRIDAHNQADLAAAYLLDLMGTPEAEYSELTTPLDGTRVMDAGYAKIVETSLEASPDMKALEARDALYTAAKRSAASERRPVTAIVGSAEMRDDDLPLTQPEGYIGVVVRMNLYDGGAARAKTLEQGRLRDRNGDDVHRLNNGVRLEARKYYLDLMSARKALEAADKSVELATESRRLATRRFEVGEGTSIEVTDSILALSIAETNREQARYQYDQAFYGLEKMTGAILPDLLDNGRDRK